MTQKSYHSGDRVILDDGETGVIVTANDDGTAQVRTENGILVSSCLDDLPCETPHNG
jgi:hypothetical protein